MKARFILYTVSPSAKNYILVSFHCAPNALQVVAGFGHAPSQGKLAKHQVILC